MTRWTHRPAALVLPALLWAGAASASAPPPGQVRSFEQRTSRGHLLRFDDRGYDVSNGSYVLRVTFEQARAMTPASDETAGHPAALGHVTYPDVWDGISVTYDTPPSGIARSTWTLEPGADPRAIRLRYSRRVELTPSGELTISFGTGALRESRPVAWQDMEGARRPVDVAFVQLDADRVGFRVGAYRRDLPLTIDPTLTWNTFLGGSSFDSGEGLAVDAGGNVYVVGYSTGTWGSPVRAYTPAGSPTGCPPDPPGLCAYDAFVAKLTSAGELVWNTFLGGGGYDAGSAIAVDALGNVYVTGQSWATWGSPRRAFTAATLTSDAFVAKVGPDGVLAWNTFLGGSSVDVGTGIAAFGTGPISICMSGHSQGSWSGALFSPRRAYSASVDAIAAKLNEDGTIAWNTFLGGTGWDQANDAAFDSSGNCYVAGYSWASWGSPVTPFTAGADGVAAKLSTAGALSWHTFFGGSGSDSGIAIAVDGGGSVYVSGTSDATWGSPLRPFTSADDASVVKLTSTGALDWSTFFGGSGDDVPIDMVVDGSSNLYITGDSKATWGSPERPYTSSTDAFATKLTSAGATGWNTFLGGSGQDTGAGIGLDGGGNVYVGGHSAATWGSPVTPFTSSSDAYVAQLGALPATTTTTSTTSTTTSTEPTTSTSSTSTTSTSTSTTTTSSTSTTTSTEAPTTTSTTSTSTTSSSSSTSSTSTTETSTTTSTSSTTTSTTIAPPCPEDPEPGCQPAASGRASLLLARGSNKLRWKWYSSATVDPADFGDPTVSTDYVLCIYDASSRRLTARALAAGDCAGRPCWGFGARSFKYADRDLTPDGLKSMSLTPGAAGRARITVQGKGDGLLVPSLPLALPVRVQLRQSTSAICWEATYSAPKDNGLTRFRAKSD